MTTEFLGKNWEKRRGCHPCENVNRWKHWEGRRFPNDVSEEVNNQGVGDVITNPVS